MKILLIYQSGTPNRDDPYINLLPTGLCYLHAYLRESGYDSLLANFSAWSDNRIREEILAFRPNIIGISQWTHNRHTSLKLAQMCRELLPESTIVMGGVHASFCYEDILIEGSPVDIVIRGEGELTLLELAARLSSKTDWRDIAGLAFRSKDNIIVTKLRKYIYDLNTLPIPSSYLDSSLGVDPEMQSEFIVTTRGCPSNCYFCSSPDFWGRKVRFRSPESIVKEILYIREKFGLIYFSIRDDTFTVDRKRVLEFCSLLQKQQICIIWNCQSRVTAIDEELLIQMKRAGCECIQLGVESGSPGILEKLGKNISVAGIERACKVIRDIGINLSIYLISDVPGETNDDIQQTIELVRRIHPDDGYVSRLAYYPGTQLYKDALLSNAITPSFFHDSPKDALYVKSTTGHHSAVLLKALVNNQKDEPERFRRQKEYLGYCYTTNVIAGEWYRKNGEHQKAEKELLEITAVEPKNPWGWFLLGDLYAEFGRVKKMKDCYKKVQEIIPNHRPSKEAL